MSEYIKLNSETLADYINQLIGLWKEFLTNTIPEYNSIFSSGDKDSNTEVSIDELYDINLFALKECFERVNQREDYFKRYHDNLKMSDFKEIGLIAFWITKFKPFHLKNNLFDDAFSLRINEQFALYFIFNAINKYAKSENKTCNVSRINSELYNEILYTMQYRDLSKEAFGCIVELIYLAIENGV